MPRVPQARSMVSLFCSNGGVYAHRSWQCSPRMHGLGPAGTARQPLPAEV